MATRYGSPEGAAQLTRDVAAWEDATNALAARIWRGDKTAGRPAAADKETRQRRADERRDAMKAAALIADRLANGYGGDAPPEVFGAVADALRESPYALDALAVVAASLPIARAALEMANGVCGIYDPAEIAAMDASIRRLDAAHNAYARIKELMPQAKA